MKRLYLWIKKLHIYAGLLSFTGFTVWGVVGIWATFLPAPADRVRPDPQVRTINFQIDGTATDQQVTDEMIVASGLPFIQTGRKPSRDSQGRLQVRYLTPNGTRRILLLEQEGKLRMESIPSPFLGFLNILHYQTFTRHNPGWEAKMWGAYNEFSMWAVIFMTLSGGYMWLATRPRTHWAWWTFGLSTLAMATLYAGLR